ncbi:MAG: hypothetical protein COX07_03200 [Bacteroidetes bacterium CG23_combo_of_CG06-09_8_20_14_all_32_9]|nr:MAG: hypothetical protein COX07_03200 [Bacteroidetes bacterium CG23_combo_of_CG06-09_8_20_14_all_32_9]
METDVLTYFEDIQQKPELSTMGNTVFKSEFSTRIKVSQNFFEFKLKASDIETLISFGRIKDLFYHEAILNLIKKSKFLQLYIQLIENQISEEEYEAELKENSDKYFINLKELNSDLDFAALVIIMQSLPKNLSVDEVTEIFGIKSQSILSKLIV